MVRPKVTIITVSFNSEKTIERTIKSVLNQTSNDFEYIIIDGGSTDLTMDIVRSYEANFEGRLKWVSEPDNGIYDAFNKGIELSTGEYIGFINSDDWYEQDTIEILCNNISSGYADVYFGLLNVWENNELVWVYCNFCSSIKTESLAHPSTFISKDAYDKFGLYNLDYVSASDYEMFIRLINNECSFKYIDSTLANFSRGGVSGTAIGYFETLDIKLKNGFISIGNYYFLLFRKRLIELARKVKVT